MIIPNKHSGYQAGIRVYPFGGGGGGEQLPGTGDSQIGNTGGTTPVGTGVAIPPPPPPPQPQTMTGQIYNQNLQSGMTDAQMRTMRSGPGQDSPFLYNSTSPNQWNDAVTQAGMTSPTGRPLAGSAQFFQPVYQPQYQDYSMGNRMGVSQFGQQPFFGGFMPQMQTPFNPYTNSFGGGFGGGFGSPEMRGGSGFGPRMPQQQFMPQMQSPFQPQMNMGMQTPFSSGMSQPAPQRTSSGPAQAIIGRSSQMRGTPNVMRRAEGGITSLMGKA